MRLNKLVKKEYDKEYRARNKDKIKEYKINWCKEHEEALRIKNRKASKKYYDKNKDKKYAKAKEWRKKNPEKIAASSRKRVCQRKKLVFDHYGAVCIGCGESDIIVLTIDHINNDGNTHRKEVGESRIYEWLIKNNFPNTFQTLCRNCNWRKYVDERDKIKCGVR
jgi:hypothetical protein